MILCLVFSGSLSAQWSKKPKNQPKYDTKPIHFGFFIGINYFDFQARKIENLTTVPGYFKVRTSVSPGYSIGIVSNLRLEKYLDLRFLPTFASTERILTFDIIDPISDTREEVVREVQSSFLEFPLELKYKSQRINNYRLYVLGGIKYSWDLASKEDVDDDRVFKITSRDLSYEIGFGVDFYFDYFKFSPQIKASFGVADLLVDDDTFLIQGIDRLLTRAIMLNLTFE